MNGIQRRLLFAIGEAQPCEFASLSMNTRMPTQFLHTALDDLQGRGFVNLHNGRYTLTPGVLDFLLNITERSAVNI